MLVEVVMWAGEVATLAGKGVIAAVAVTAVSAKLDAAVVMTAVLAVAIVTGKAASVT